MQDVKVVSLWDTFPMIWLFWQVISLDERNALEVGAEYASGKQSRHACTDHDGVALGWRAGKLQSRFDATIHCAGISQRFHFIAESWVQSA